MYKYPDAIYNVDRALQKAGLRRLDMQDFESSTHQQIIQAVHGLFGAGGYGAGGLYS